MTIHINSLLTYLLLSSSIPFCDSINSHPTNAPTTNHSLPHSSTPRFDPLMDLLYSVQPFDTYFQDFLLYSGTVVDHRIVIALIFCFILSKQMQNIHSVNSIIIITMSVS